GDERAVHNQPRVAFLLCDIVKVIVNAVAIEGDGRVAKQQDRRGGDLGTPVTRGGRHTAFELGRGGCTIDNILLFTHANRTILHVLMVDSEKQKAARATLLFLDVVYDRASLRGRADPQRRMEAHSPSRPHAVAFSQRGQQAAMRRMPVATEFSVYLATYEVRPLPQMRQGGAHGRHGSVQRQGDLCHVTGIEIVGVSFATADPA